MHKPALLIRALWLPALLALGACQLTTTTPTPQAAAWSLSPTNSLSLPQASSPSETPTAVSTATSQPTATPEGLAIDVDKNINPLTGLPMLDAAILERRPVAVKITLYPRSNRPQWGLSLADIVYEYYHNNDLTRFHAIFYGHDAAQAGPIRSARLPDDTLMDMYGSVMAYASADYRIRERLANEHPGWQLVSILEGICPPQPVCRYDPEAFNYLLADTAAVSQYVLRGGGDATRQALEGMRFSATRPQGGEDVAQIYLRYSYADYAYWDYDAASGRYVRYQDAWEDIGGRDELYSLLTDRLTGQPIATDNVVVLYVPHFYFAYKAPANGQPATEVVDWQLSGRGLAYAFRDGQAYELEWVVEDGQVLGLEMADGAPYPFKPGTTFFQVVNVGSQVARTDEVWRFTFEPIEN